MKKEDIEANPILKITFEFSLLIIDYCDLLDTIKKYTVSSQLLKSGTSIGANSMEAQNAEIRANFIHKIKLQQKRLTKLNIGFYSAIFPINFQNVIPYS
ncbi:MAG TPA: four helix bundle protein [Hanamia sp.]|nr:four helix bundle protein [Hanamia sp.]